MSRPIRQAALLPLLLPSAQRAVGAVREDEAGGREDEGDIETKGEGMIEDYWQNCYNLGWTDLLIPPAIAHPAKMSRALVFRLVAHLLDEGLIQPGQTVIDPFAGVGTTALPCLMAGLNYVGVELEPRFADWAQQNIDLWNAKFSAMPKWTGTARIIQGDSRNLAQLVRGAGVVSSPPYAESLQGEGKPDYDPEKITAAKANGTTAARSTWGVSNSVGVLTGKGYGSTPGQLGAMKAGDLGAVVSSPPFQGTVLHDGGPAHQQGGALHSEYGAAAGQLANLPSGNHAEALVSSPPFAGNSGGRGEASRNGIDAALFDRHSGGMTGGMGDDERNLGNLPVRGFAEAVVSSPGYGGAELADNRKTINPTINGNGADGKRRGGTLANVIGSYASEGNVSAESGETFWAAARAILLQCAMVLPSGAPAVWVTKRFVKNGQIVDFTGQWIALCEACGFRLLHHHRAWLVKNQGVGQVGIDGEVESKEIKRMSFFRRLHMKRNPHLAIEWEDVICTVRL